MTQSARRRQVRLSGARRPATRGGGEGIEFEHGITVYPARVEGGGWRGRAARAVRGGH